MFQYYDNNKKEYVDFDELTNKLLSNTNAIHVYQKIGDSHYLYDMSTMRQNDLFNNISRRIRKV